jgi:hypothetical protein
MNIMLQNLFIRRLTVCLLLASLLLAGCESAPEPTLPPQPTLTFIPTSPPSPTPDPAVQELIEGENLMGQMKFAEGIEKFASVLELTQDEDLRAETLDKLATYARVVHEEAALLLSQAPVADEQHREACRLNVQALLAYQAVMKTGEQAVLSTSPLYQEAAALEAELVECYTKWLEPKQSASEVIRTLLAHLSLYPDQAEIKEVLTQAVLDLYRNQVRDDFETASEEVLENGELIKTAVGNFDLDGTSIAHHIDGILLRRDLCYGNPPSLEMQTSADKRFYSCDPTAYGILSQAGASAQQAGEIWYLVESERIDNPAVTCSGYNTTSKKNFTYQYAGQWRLVYTIKDAVTGRVMDTKTFYSSAPQCIFTSCSLNQSTNIAKCTGGEAKSGFDQALLSDWLTRKIK